VAPSADTSPGTLDEKLSRRASHQGAIFASPGERYICPGGIELSRAGFMNAVNRWEAKGLDVTV